MAITSDCSTLIDFYFAMHGENWYRKDGWAEKSTGCCEWYGVECDDMTRVIRLNLAGVGMEGALSKRVFELEKLMRL